MGDTGIETNLETYENLAMDQSVNERKDALLDPLTRLAPGLDLSTSSSTDKPPDLTGLTGSLKGAMANTVRSSSVVAADRMRGRLRKVTDPVAFMTSAKLDERSKIDYSGSYDDGVSNLDSETGFYELAKAECSALVGELSAEIASGNITRAELQGFNALISLVESYGQLYTSLQVTGNVHVWQKKSSEATKTVRAQIASTHAALKLVPDQLIGDATSSIERCLSEMMLFADSWETVSKTEGTNASKNMGKLFLQTNERYRTQLNAYGMLDERGGDSTGTANKRLSEETGYTISDRDRGEERAEEQGGWMAVALKSYGMEPEQERLRDMQMIKLIQRLKTGEFETEDEYVNAFQQEIGGGATSRQYMGKLKQEALGVWNTHMGLGEGEQEGDSYVEAGKDFSSAKNNVKVIDRAVSSRDKNAKSREDNISDFGSLSAKEKRRLEDSGDLSVQETARLNMDQKSADLAYEKAQNFQAIAQRELKTARALLASGDGKIAEGLEHHTRALQYIAQAKLHAAHVRGTKDAALMRGLSYLDSEIVNVEQLLSDNQEIYKQLVQKRNELNAMIDARSSTVEDYNPERLKVPQPVVFMNGKKLENTSYAKVSIELSGPMYGVLYWLGGVEGELSNTTSLDDKGVDNWTKASIKITAGLKANLWLVEAGVKVSGFFEAEKKGPAGLIDTLEAGTEELMRWAYAYWYKLGSMSKEISTVMNVAKQVGDKNYGTLQKAAAGANSINDLANSVTTAGSGMQQLHSALSQSLTSVFDNGPGETKIDSKAIDDMANEAVPIDDILAGFQNLKNASDLVEVQERLGADRKTLGENITKTRDEAVKEIKAVDPGQNDPNVKFKAGVGVEGFVGSTLGTKANIQLSVAKVWSISDGDKEGFDFKTQSAVTYTAKAEIAMAAGSMLSIQLKAMPKDEKDGGGWEIEVEADIPIKTTKHNIDGDSVMGELRKICEFEGAKTVVDPKAWIKKLPYSFGERIVKKLEKAEVPENAANPFEIEKISTTYMKVGGGFHLANKEIKKWWATFGLFTKLEKKSTFGSVAYEAGNVTKFTSEDAKKEAVDLKKQKQLEALMTNPAPSPTTAPKEDDTP
jgi:hypothetical protein